jgi:hypothetical protein
VKTQDCAFKEKALSKYLENSVQPYCYLTPSGMLTLTPSPGASLRIGRLVAVKNELMSIGTVEIPDTFDEPAAVKTPSGDKIFQWLEESAKACDQEATVYAATCSYDRAWQSQVEALTLFRTANILRKILAGEPL